MIIVMIATFRIPDLRPGQEIIEAYIEKKKCYLLNSWAQDDEMRKWLKASMLVPHTIESSRVETLELCK